MRLINFKIEGLFDLFSYNIDLNQEEDLTILTGPNGYGKTTVLNVLYSLFNYRFFYFQKLVFSEITLLFDDQSKLNIKKTVIENKKTETTRVIIGHKLIEKEQVFNCKVSLYLYDKTNKNIGTYEYTGAKSEGIETRIERYIPFVHRISPEEWIDERRNRILGLDELLNEYADKIPQNLLENLKNNGLNNEAIRIAISSLKVYLIKEQRLIKQLSNYQNRSMDREVSFINTIQEYARDLGGLIKNKQVESLQKTQQLDSTFPRRLLDANITILSEKDFIERFRNLKDKYEQLQKFGLITNSLDVPSYDENKENARVLSVYLSDSEQKTAIFDDLLNRIELFTNILNQKRFTFKSIQIDKDNGFIFRTNKDKNLSLTDLSSGEQHEVVLLYELLFKVEPDTLVLIDEPEISLHVSWQQEFIKDLLKIAEMQKIRFIVATHSPTIINNRYDISVDLYALTQNHQ
jgi:predicted ATP-binding protein involved in virulence